MGLLKDVKEGMKDAVSKVAGSDVMDIFSKAPESPQEPQEAVNGKKAESSTPKRKNGGKNDSRASEDKPRMLTHEEFCEKELQEAREKGWEDPDFDYRKIYRKGQQIFYVRVYNSPYLKEKHIVPAKIREIYPRTVIGVEPSSQCVCIDYKRRDMIFLTQYEAQQCYNSINLPEEKYRKVRIKDEDEDYDEDDGKDTGKNS